MNIRNVKSVRRKPKALGQILLEARRALDLSRSALSELSGVAENSIVRYEKAGLEPDGQYPPAPKLASLCFHLGIPCADALWSSLSAEEFARVDEKSVHDLVNHPAYSYLQNQYERLLEQNHFLRETSKCFLGLNEDFPEDEEDFDWLYAELKKAVALGDGFSERMQQLGCVSFEVIQTVTPGYEEKSGWVFDAGTGDKISARDQLPAPFFAWSVRKQLLSAIRNIDALLPGLDEMTQAEALALSKNYSSPEDDLPSPPSSDDET